MAHVGSIARILGGLALCFLFVGTTRAATLYEEMGGEAKMRAISKEFTAVILADPRINFTFANTDLAKFEQLIFEQFCNLTGGPCQYTGRSMQESHEKLNVTNAQFNALAEDLYIAFDNLHVPYHLQNRLMVLLAPMQRDVVKKHPTGPPQAAPKPEAAPTR